MWKRNSLRKPKNSGKLVICHLLSLEQSPTERGTLPCSQQEITVQARGTGSFRFSRATTSCRSCSCFRQKRGWDSLLPSLVYNLNFSSASFISLPLFLFATVVFVLFLTGGKSSPQVEVAFRIHRGPGSPLNKAPHHKQGQHFHCLTGCHAKNTNHRHARSFLRIKTLICQIFSSLSGEYVNLGNEPS